jgi:Crp-like helix-turn-helix domain
VGTPAVAGGIDLLSLLSSAKQRRVLEGSKRAGYRAGTVAFRPGPPGRVFLVAEGLARVYMSVRDGRDDLRLIAVRTLGTVSERLAFDLLDRACQSQLVYGRLEVRATHDELAYSIGSSREVVGRNLKGLRTAGIIETAPGRTRIHDPERPAAVVRAFVN